MADSAGDKTEPATAKRRDDARQKGQVCKSQEVTNVGIFIAVLITLALVSGDQFDQMALVVRHHASNVPHGDISAATALALIGGTSRNVALAFLPLVAAAFCASLLTSVMQIGLTFASESITFRLDKLNPAGGLKNLVSLRSIVKLITSLAKLAVIGTICWTSIEEYLPAFMSLSFSNPAVMLSTTGSAILVMALRVAIAMALIAFADWLYQKWQYEKSLRMSKQEVKDEAKMMEGDPQNKNRIRQAQFEMARKRMFSKVPEADVVVRNPTHYAVALRYAPATMGAPRVVAKGVDHLARRILDLAFEHRIPIITNPPLARTLYRTTELDGDIPFNLYKAVAHILGRIYRRQRRKAAMARG